MMWTIAFFLRQPGASFPSGMVSAQGQRSFLGELFTIVIIVNNN